MTINRIGLHRTAAYTALHQTTVIVLVHAFDVLKYLARVWRHLCWTPCAWAL